MAHRGLSSNTFRLNPGPFVRTIRHFGETVGFAIGLFAECSSTWDTFARYFANERARAAKIRTGAALDLPILTTRFHQDIVRNWGSLAAHHSYYLATLSDSTSQLSAQCLNLSTLNSIALSNTRASSFSTP